MASGGSRGVGGLTRGLLSRYHACHESRGSSSWLQFLCGPAAGSSRSSQEAHRRPPLRAMAFTVGIGWEGTDCTTNAGRVKGQHVALRDRGPASPKDGGGSRQEALSEQLVWEREVPPEKAVVLAWGG